MKKLLFAFILLCSVCAFAEKVTFRTGDAFARSLSDFYFPTDIAFTGSRCSVTSVKRVEKDLWCLSLAAFRSGQQSVPVVYEYYVRPGDSIRLRRLETPMEVCTVKVVSVGWNEIVMEMD